MYAAGLVTAVIKLVVQRRGLLHDLLSGHLRSPSPVLV
jgi:hypothetical protein